MRGSNYLKRLSSDLDRWVERGLITADTRTALAADAAAFHRDASEGRGLLTNLALMAVLIGVLTLVAANWSALSGVLRLGILFGLSALATLGAAEARHRGAVSLANGAAGLAAVLFGGGLVIIGQLYHSEATTAGFLRVWCLGATVLAALLGGAAPWLVTALLSVGWTGAALFDGGNLPGSAPLGPWLVLPVWAAIVSRAQRAQHSLSLHLVAIGVFIWLTPWLVTQLSAADFGATASGLTLTAFYGAISAAFEVSRRRIGAYGLGIGAGWGAWIAGGIFGGTLIAALNDSGLGVALALAALGLAGFASLIGYGSAPGRGWLRGAGVAGFISMAVILFAFSAGLLGAGVVLIVFGIGLWGLLSWSNNRRQRQEAEAAS